MSALGGGGAAKDPADGRNPRGAEAPAERGGAADTRTAAGDPADQRAEQAAIDRAVDLAEHQNVLLEAVLRRVERMGQAMERANFTEFLALYRQPRRLVLLNFVAGLSRGLGIAVGFLLLGALVVYLLREVVALNLPGIGRFLANLIAIIQAELRTTHGA